MIIRFFLTLFLGFVSIQIFAQSVKGRVVDSETLQPLAFVSIGVEGSAQSVVSDIDGNFTLKARKSNTVLIFNYVGYKHKTEALRNDSSLLLVKLEQNQLQLAEVVVRVGESPANRIIRQVLENRNKNNPEKLPSFSYMSYNKMSFNYQEDTTLHSNKFPSFLDSLLVDTADLRIRKQRNKQSLLLTEFISQRYFEHPSKNNERVLASRVSGLNDPSFTLLATEMQSFTFYNDFVSILNKQYLNPVSPGSIGRYRFLLLDTLQTETNDTVFVISFQPRKGAAFSGLKGLLYINTHGYAIQNVIAEQARPEAAFVVRIQQTYQQIDSSQWFPVQLNTDLLFKKLQYKTRFHTYYIVGSGHTYISHINLHPDLSDIKFNNIELQANDDASEADELVWDEFRPAPLSKRDSATYRVLDSIGKAKNFDGKLKAFESILFGNIPVGPLNVDYRKLFNYNEYEGIRMGLGLSTNEKVSSYFSIGGYGSYGFGDKSFKYGANVQIFQSWNSPNYLSVKYVNDVAERGRLSFLDDHVLGSTDWLRKFLVFQMDPTESTEIAMGFRLFQYFRMSTFLDVSHTLIDGYTFLPTSTYQGFNFTEAGINLKFGFKEKFMKTPRGNLISLGTKYPMLWFNYKRGLNALGGNFEYSKYELRISKTIRSRGYGKMQIVTEMGLVSGKTPISNLYNGNGSYRRLTIESENSFATMGMDEFFSDRFASLFIKHNFGRLFGNYPLFSPEVCAISNAGVGDMRHPEYHNNVRFRTLEKGYYESGVLINKLMGVLGFGIFYRYGPYAYTKTANNFAYKFTFSLNM